MSPFIGSLLISIVAGVLVWVNDGPQWAIVMAAYLAFLIVRDSNIWEE